jgi:MFS family permease
MTAAIFAVNSGRIASRFGRAVPALIGTVAVAAAALYWIVAAPAHPDYVTGFLPGLFLGGIGAGLTQAPMFAAASTLPPHRATTGSAVLNMARQVGSAVGVAVLVALLASQHPDQLALFQRGWGLQAGAAAAAAVLILVRAVIRPSLSHRRAAAAAAATAAARVPGCEPTTA